MAGRIAGADSILRDLERIDALCDLLLAVYPDATDVLAVTALVRQRLKMLDLLMMLGPAATRGSAFGPSAARDARFD
jgi:hypothetical protein